MRQPGRGNSSAGSVADSQATHAPQATTVARGSAPVSMRCDPNSPLASLVRIPFNKRKIIIVGCSAWKLHELAREDIEKALRELFKEVVGVKDLYAPGRWAKTGRVVFLDHDHMWKFLRSSKKLSFFLGYKFKTLTLNSISTQTLPRASSAR